MWLFCCLKEPTVPNWKTNQSEKVDIRLRALGRLNPGITHPEKELERQEVLRKPEFFLGSETIWATVELRV